MGYGVEVGAGGRTENLIAARPKPSAFPQSQCLQEGVSFYGMSRLHLWAHTPEADPFGLVGLNPTYGSEIVV